MQVIISKKFMTEFKSVEKQKRIAEEFILKVGNESHRALRKIPRSLERR